MLSQNVNHCHKKELYICFNSSIFCNLMKNKVFKYLGQLLIYKTKYTQNCTMSA